MKATDRKQRLFEDIVRLRRAGRATPRNRDLMTVRAGLERELGGTVSRRLAARVLGTSHTALDRWVETGDLPMVYSRNGRLEVPVPALMNIYDAVEAARADGSLRYPLVSAMRAGRATSKPTRFDEANGASTPRSGHDRAQARGLAYHRAVARRLRKPMVREAQHVLFRWRDEGKLDPRYADKWEELLDHPIPAIRRAIVQETSEGDDLRQNSPLAGLLSESERRQIINNVR